MMNGDVISRLVTVKGLPELPHPVHSHSVGAQSPNTTMKSCDAHSVASSSELGRAGVRLMPSVLDKALKGEL